MIPLITIILIITSATVQAEVLRYTQKPSEEELQVVEIPEKYPFDILNDKKDRTDIYGITRLAIKEWYFLKGLDQTCIKIEKGLDKAATFFGLKGDIPLVKNEEIYIHKKSKKKPSLKSIILPERIKWNIGFDVGSQVTIGEIELNKFISIQSETGKHNEVKILFKYNF